MQANEVQTYSDYELWEPKYYITIHKWDESFPIVGMDKEKIYFIKADEDTREIEKLWQTRENLASYSISKRINDVELEQELLNEVNQ